MRSARAQPPATGSGVLSSRRAHSCVDLGVRDGLFHRTDESIVQCGAKRERRPQRDHREGAGWASPTLVSVEPRMRGGKCPTRRDGRWGSEWSLHHAGESAVGQGRARSDAVPPSLEEIPKGVQRAGTREGGLALLQAWVAVWGRAQSRASPAPPGFFTQSPPPRPSVEISRKMVSMECRTLSARAGTSSGVSPSVGTGGSTRT